MTETNDDSAARWAGRLDDGPLDADARDELTAWLRGDPGRAGALLRAEACLARVRGLAVVASDRPLAARDGIAIPRRRFTAWLLVGSGAVAASALFLLSRPESVRYATATGEVRRVPLRDGSVVSINTASSLHVSIDDARRRVVLDRGEAWFQVAHDRSRPFVVEAGPIRVRAVGTAFSMRRRELGVDILVTEGVVEARSDATPGEIRLIAGQKAFLSLDGQPSRTVTMPDEVERTLAWRHGEMALEGHSLGQAVAEMNRYNVLQISVDASLARAPLVGYFRTDDPTGFAASAAELVGGRTIRSGNTIIISAKPDS